MAQRSFSCPECGADVYIPEGYFKAAILCGSCGAAVDRRSGEPWEGDPSGLATAPSEPPPSGPVASQAGSSSKPLILIIVISLVLIGGALGALFLIGPGEADGDGLSTEDWVEHKSGQGGFTVEFPGEPRGSVERIPTGAGVLEFQRSFTRQDGRVFCVAYANQVLEGAARLQMRSFLDATASEAGSSLTTTRDVIVSGVEGMAGEIPLNDERLLTAMVLRTEFRYFMAYVENHTPADAEAVVKFLESLELVPGVASPTPMEAQAVIPVYLKVGELCDAHIEITGGSTPLRTAWPPNLPEGLRGEFDGRRYVIMGKPVTAGINTVDFAFEDAYGQPSDAAGVFRIVPAEGPVQFNRSFVTGGVAGMPYEAWVEIVNHVPDVVEYEVVWNDFDLPDNVVGEHVTEDEDKRKYGLDARFDYLRVSGEPRRAGTSRCTVTLTPSVDSEDMETPKEQAFTFEITIRRYED